MTANVRRAESAPERLVIFDTSLRDGEQSPGCSLDAAQKLRFAQALAGLGVDVIEAGYPNASVGDFESVREIARQVEGPTICALARCNDADIDRAGEALAEAKRARIHVFIAASPIHREHKLKMSREQVVERAVAGVRRAASWVADVEFSAEDASRSEPEFLAELFSAVIAAGATTINVPDTVGYTTPSEFGELIRYLKQHVVGVERATISAHCHNDLGLAVANSLAAIEAGARQVECTVTGIGERAGNAALEEIAMAVRTRPERYGVASGIRTPKLFATARLLASLIGASVPRNKAIVGDNAFAHESGIHQHGMIAERSTYEIMRPEDVGFPGTRLVLGKHSGKAAVRDRLASLGYSIDDAALDGLMVSFKQLADRKKEVFDADLEALWLGVDDESRAPWQLESLQVHTAIGSGSGPTASAVLKNAEGRVVREAAIGDGPIDAIARAVSRATGIALDVRDFQLRSVTEGGDAQGQATVRISHQGREYRGQAVSTDVIEASAKALLEAVNRIAVCATARAARVRPTGTG
jgi:2-isopropylmalate synthase